MNASDEALLNMLRSEAREIATALRADPDTAAVILSGPLALGIATGREKLYFAVLVDRDDGVIEHHFLDEGSGEVKRPIEMGIFPVAVARHLVAHGYRDMVSYKSLEAFRCGEVLWERGGIGTEIVEGAKRHIPNRSFIGESLHGAVSALDDAVSLLRGGDFGNAVLVAREAVMKAVGMVIEEAGGAAGAPVVETARTLLPPELYEGFLEVMGLGETDNDAARAAARSAREFAGYMLREIGVNPEQVFGPAGEE